MAYIPNSGSVVAFQGDPSKLQASVFGTVHVNNGATDPVAVMPPLLGYLEVGTSARSVITVIQGSVAVSVTPVQNQSVSGTVNIGNYPTNQNISGSVVAFQASLPWVVTGSVQTSANQSVSGTVGASVLGTVPVSQFGAWTTSVVGTVFVAGSIASVGNSSVQILNFPANTSVSGTVNVGNLPTTQNVSGSVVAFQGAGWSGSVAAWVQPFTTVVHNKYSVATAGTRVQLPSNAIDSLTVKALAANTGTIFVGGSTVSSANGFQLAAGDTLSMDVGNSNLVYIDSTVNGEGVTWIAIS